MADSRILSSEVYCFLLPKDLGEEENPIYLEDITVEKLDLINQSLLIHTPFPNSVFIDLDNGFELNLLHKECGHYDEYLEREVIVQITNCRIVEKYVRDLILSYNDQYVVHLTCLIAGDIKVIKDG